jgi:hypothetical protein
MFIVFFKWFFKKIGKIDQPLANWTKRCRRKKTKINKIRDEKGVLPQTPMKSRIRREYFEDLYAKKLENLEEMDTFLDAFDQPKLNQENIRVMK